MIDLFFPQLKQMMNKPIFYILNVFLVDSSLKITFHTHISPYKYSVLYEQQQRQWQ